MGFSITITERSSGGKKFRPSTVVDFEKSTNRLICVTPWGAEEVAIKVIESIKSFIAMANKDSDVTVPYARKENLQQMGNILRMAVITASEKIHNEFNKEEYTSGFEIFAAIQDGPQWIYVSCGHPSLIIKREGVGIVVLSQAIDLNVLTLRTQIHDPLPNQLLGLGQHPPIQFGNLRIKASDQLALVSRTYIPNSFFQLGADNFNSDQIAQSLSADNQEIPFWLGFVQFNG